MLRYASVSREFRTSLFHFLSERRSWSFFQMAAKQNLSIIFKTLLKFQCWKKLFTWQSHPWFLPWNRDRWGIIASVNPLQFGNFSPTFLAKSQYLQTTSLQKMWHPTGRQLGGRSVCGDKFRPGTCFRHDGCSRAGNSKQRLRFHPIPWNATHQTGQL